MDNLKNSLKNGHSRGYYGEFGARYAPEILQENLIELEKAFESAINDKKFIDEFNYYLREYVGRPNPLYYAEALTERIGGAKIYFKSEHLNHLGAHKINNSLFQVLLAKYMGKKKILAETGAGAHLIATAACCAKFSLPIEGHMGIDDIKKQHSNVIKAKLFGAKVVSCVDGTGKKGVLKDACTSVLKAWSSDPSSFYCWVLQLVPIHFLGLFNTLSLLLAKKLKNKYLKRKVVFQMQ